MKINLNVQEILSRNIELEIPDGLSKGEIGDYISAEVDKLYSNKQSILDSSDFTGFVDVIYDDGKEQLNCYFGL